MSGKLNILVTGSEGQLGSSLRRHISGNKDNFIFTDINELDITDEKKVKEYVVSNNIDVIINCAAFTNVEAAEDNPEKAFLLNGEAPKFLAEALREREGFLIHISTDYVFGGELVNTPIKEDALTYPTGVYGITKLSGEENIIKSGVKSIIFRTSWLYSPYGNNFVKKIISLLNQRDEIKVVLDQCGTPTYSGDLAKAILEIISSRKFEGNEGIYHYSNEGVCSWFDFAQEIARLSGFTERKKILPCLSKDFPSKVKRPAYSVLNKTKVKETFGIEIPYWSDSLKNCIREL